MNSLRSPSKTSRKPVLRKSGDSRRGAAAIELAVISPLFVLLILGAVQSGINLDMQTKMQAAVRQAGRLASMDYSKRVQANQTGNQKVIQDIKNVLTAEGLAGNAATVTITHAEGENAGSTFNLSSTANDLQYFKITVEIPYSALNSTGLLPNTFEKLSASIVNRKDKIISF